VVVGGAGQRIQAPVDDPHVAAGDAAGLQGVGGVRQQRRQWVAGQPAPRPELLGPPHSWPGLARGHGEQLDEQVGARAAGVLAGQAPLAGLGDQPVDSIEAAPLGVDLA
jgi:hypothetical protein